MSAFVSPDKSGKFTFNQLTGWGTDLVEGKPEPGQYYRVAHCLTFIFSTLFVLGIALKTKTKVVTREIKC